LIFGRLIVDLGQPGRRIKHALKRHLWVIKIAAHSINTTG
tara:strand:- start:33 stop:152 length:120 start_codon:yes stop_codon:yes gene_type:complete